MDFYVLALVHSSSSLVHHGPVNDGGLLNLPTFRFSVSIRRENSDVRIFTCETNKQTNK